jgi:hypothetical protein
MSHSALPAPAPRALEVLSYYLEFNPMQSGVGGWPTYSSSVMNALLGSST